MIIVRTCITSTTCTNRNCISLWWNRKICSCSITTSTSCTTTGRTTRTSTSTGNYKIFNQTTTCITTTSWSNCKCTWTSKGMNFIIPICCYSSTSSCHYHWRSYITITRYISPNICITGCVCTTIHFTCCSSYPKSTNTTRRICC